MPSSLDSKHIVLGVSGSIACHKAVDLASKLVQQGALVDVVMTRAASNFVTPLAFQAITHRPVLSDIFNPQTGSAIDHVEIAMRADVVVVAPATANIISKISSGLADDALTTTVLATQAPIIVCPAMDGYMYGNPATKENIERLHRRGLMIAGPSEGHLASGIEGKGRLLESSEIIGHIRLVLGKNGDLANRKVVVTAGGTQEALDPVRFLGNRSSGKMGYSLAEAARDRGASTVIVTAPNRLPDPVGTRVEQVVTAEEMSAALAIECDDADALIMAAAVSDWRPHATSSSKVKKSSAENWTVELTKTPDVVSKIQRKGLIKVGFAAETENIEVNAQAKLLPKGLHLIAANDVSNNRVFGDDNNKVVLLDHKGIVEELELMSKYDVGHRILDRVVSMMQ